MRRDPEIIAASVERCVRRLNQARIRAATLVPAPSRYPLRGSRPPQQLPALFDHLVGAQQERFRYREAERLGGFEIDD